VAPFSYETVWSYVARLAHANHLEAKDLRRYLAERSGGYPRPDWLATASRYPLAVLRTRLKGLAADERDATRQRRHSRPACRLCMAQRCVHEPVYCWLPEYVTVCRRHQLWVGPPAQSWADQKSLASKPSVMAAARNHARLYTISTAEFDLRDARRIVTWWERHRRCVEKSGSHIDIVDAHITTYPEVIALAGLLAAYRCRIWDSAGTPVELARTIAEFHNRINHRLHIHHPNAEMHAVDAWVDDQRIVAAARTTNWRSTVV
jgi:hypothetical protein